MFDARRLATPESRTATERMDRKSWRSRIPRRLRQFADWLEAVDSEKNRNRAEHGSHTSADKFGFVRQTEPGLKTSATRYNATDPVWHDVEGDGFLVPLREHVRRLYTACLEIAPEALAGDWYAVAHNLKLAYSLTDLSADTDVDGSGMWCSPAADYDAVDSEITAKHLAATIVFTFVWCAYERAVDTMRPSKIGKGAVGRDMIMGLASCHMPYLRGTLFDALGRDRGGTNFKHQDMRRVLRAGSAAGVAAEYLRQFRNRLIHGDLPRPEPKDWGEKSEYVPNRDCDLGRFHASIRLLLLLIQILAGKAAHEDLELSHMLEEACDAGFLLKHLHCDRPIGPDAPELALGIPGWPLPAWR